MSKKPVTWMDVIREQLAKLRKEGKTPSIGDVTPYAKKEWAQIKAGKHPLYSQGSGKGKSAGKSAGKSMKKGKHNKTQKMSKSSMSSQQDNSMKQMLAKVHLCKKCTGKIQKYLKTQKGGSGCGCEQTGGSCGCDKMTGGKGKNKKMRKTKKNKKMKGGDDMKESFTEETEASTGLLASEEAEPVTTEAVEEV